MKMLAKHMAGAAAFALLAACNSSESPVVPETDAAVVEPATSAEATDVREDIPPLGEPALWTVMDEDTTVHMFGTVHILRPETEWKTDALRAVLDEVDALYFEADVTSPEAAAEMASLVPRLGVFTDGTRLSDLLDEEQAREVQETADIIGVPMSAIEPMKPWLATVQMSVLALEKQGYDAGSGVEMVLGEYAEDNNIPTRYLETAAQQLGFFADLPMDDQIDFLVTSAIQIEDEPNMLDELVSEWAEGDVDDLAAMMAEPDVMGSDMVYDVLIVERNANWTEQVKALMEAEAGTFMLAVGAAHLAGEDSVVEMLRADGYEVSGP